MPNSKQAEKRVRQNEGRRIRNKARSRTVKSQARKFDEAVASKDKAKSETEFRQYTKLLDKAVAKGFLAKNRASRLKSHAATALNSLA